MIRHKLSYRSLWIIPFPFYNYLHPYSGIQRGGTNPYINTHDCIGIHPLNLVIHISIWPYLYSITHMCRARKMSFCHFLNDHMINYLETELGGCLAEVKVMYDIVRGVGLVGWNKNIICIPRTHSLTSIRNYRVGSISNWRWSLLPGMTKHNGV